MPRALYFAVVVSVMGPGELQAQGIASVLLRSDSTAAVSASFSGELRLMADTLLFQVESAVLRHDYAVPVTVVSIRLALGRVGPGGSLEVGSQGYGSPRDVEVPPGERLELGDAFMGLRLPDLDESLALHPIVVLEAATPTGSERSIASLDRSLADLFGRAEARRGPEMCGRP